jgi:hypothetical protein
MTGPVEVQFLSLVTGSSQVRRRVFESYDAYCQWLPTVAGMVEVVSVRLVVNA